MFSIKIPAGKEFFKAPCGKKKEKEGKKRRKNGKREKSALMNSNLVLYFYE